MKTEPALIVFPLQEEGSLPGARLVVSVQKSERNEGKKLPVILICPGGGYDGISEHEAEPLAQKFFEMGFHTAVLRYSCRPAVFPTALLEAARAMEILHDHAEQWRIEEKKIIILGCSAGGHLAASLGVFWQKPWLAEKSGVPNEKLRPAGMILCYPVITSGRYANKGSLETLLMDRYEELKEELSLEKQVTEQTPPAFLWHTWTDTCVPVENSFLMMQALKEHGIPSEFHMYPAGGHGLTYCEGLKEGEEGYKAQESCRSWLALAKTWVEQL